MEITFTPMGSCTFTSEATAKRYANKAVEAGFLPVFIKTKVVEHDMLNDFAKEVHKNAVAHGWWDDSPSFPEIIALCHCELSEALQEYRAIPPDSLFACAANYQGDEPVGIAVELADCILRILDYCAAQGIDIDAVLRAKHEYNKTRPYRHGGKRC